MDAHVRVLSPVHPLMDHQVTLPVEASPTIRAPVRSLACVGLDVFPEDGTLAKILATITAAIRGLHSLGSQMFLKAGDVAKAFPTVSVFEHFILSRVGSLMHNVVLSVIKAVPVT